MKTVVPALDDAGMKFRVTGTLVENGPFQPYVTLVAPKWSENTNTNLECIRTVIEASTRSKRSPHIQMDNTTRTTRTISSLHLRHFSLEVRCLM